MPEINLDGRLGGDGHPPLVIAELELIMMVILKKQNK